jgi:hypothetical protein
MRQTRLTAQDEAFIDTRVGGSRFRFACLPTSRAQGFMFTSLGENCQENS